MGRSCFCRILLLCFLLLLFSNNGFGRKLIMEMSVQEDYAIAADSEQGMSREMIELDYAYAEPNFNGRSGYLFPSVPVSPPPPPPSPPPESGY